MSHYQFPLHLAIQPIIGRNREPIAQEALARIPGHSIGAYVRELEADPSPTPLYHFQIQVIEKVCLFLQATPPSTPIWINLSQRSLLSEAYLTHIAHLLKAAPIPNIGLEITETYPLSRHLLTQRLALIAHQIAPLPIILDDFTNCHLSYERLASFNFNFVKLSTTFVASNLTTKTGRKKLANTIQTINKQGAKVVAEGIENKNYYAFLKKIGAFAFQGFLFPQKLYLP